VSDELLRGLGLPARVLLLLSSNDFGVPIGSARTDMLHWRHLKSSAWGHILLDGKQSAGACKSERGGDALPEFYYLLKDNSSIALSNQSTETLKSLKFDISRGFIRSRLWIAPDLISYRFSTFVGFYIHAEASENSSSIRGLSLLLCHTRLSLVFMLLNSFTTILFVCLFL